MLSGDNGLLKRAGNARDDSIVGQEKETIALAYNSALAKKVSNGNSTVITDSELNAELDNSEATASGNPIIVTFSKSGNAYEIDANGIIKETTPINPNASNLSPVELASLETNGITEIPNSSIINEELKDTDKIKAVITGDVPITTEMTYITGTKDTGVVVSIDGSEFVWVPVPVAIATVAPSTTGVDLSANPSIERPMAILQSGSDTNYQGVLYDFSGTTSTARSIVSATGTSGYREPAYLTDSSYADKSSYNTVGITQNSLQGEYNSMVASVSKYGGFYVGRYELGLEETNPVSKPASASVTTASANNSNTSMWYGLYSKCKSYSSDNLTSTMMWGSQYDAMMNWMAKTGKTVGTANSSKYNRQQTTGSKAEDVINNIFDLYGCHFEWTLGATSKSNRAYRGGGYDWSYSPGDRSDQKPYKTDTYLGSRLSLYIK